MPRGLRARCATRATPRRTRPAPASAPARADGSEARRASSGLDSPFDREGYRVGQVLHVRLETYRHSIPAGAPFHAPQPDLCGAERGLETCRRRSSVERDDELEEPVVEVTLDLGATERRPDALALDDLQVVGEARREKDVRQTRPQQEVHRPSRPALRRTERSRALQARGACEPQPRRVRVVPERDQAELAELMLDAGGKEHLDRWLRRHASERRMNLEDRGYVP